MFKQLEVSNFPKLGGHLTTLMTIRYDSAAVSFTGVPRDRGIR